MGGGRGLAWIGFGITVGDCGTLGTTFDKLRAEILLHCKPLGLALPQENLLNSTCA